VLAVQTRLALQSQLIQVHQSRTRQPGQTDGRGITIFAHVRNRLGALNAGRSIHSGLPMVRPNVPRLDSGEASRQILQQESKASRSRGTTARGNQNFQDLEFCRRIHRCGLVADVKAMILHAVEVR